MPDQELPPVYPGSVVGRCLACDVAVWVGPRLQEAIEVGDVVIGCFPCVVAARAALPTTVVSLGNPYLPKPGTGSNR